MEVKFQKAEQYNVFHENKAIFGQVLNDSKRIFKEKASKIVDQLIVGFDKENITIGFDTRQQIIERGFEYYQKLKESGGKK